jgi:hypothetical protein
MFRGPGYLSRYSDSLRAGRSGDRIPVVGQIFRTRPRLPWGPPSLQYIGYVVFTQISSHSAHEGGKVVSPTHRPPLPHQEIFLVLISFRGLVDPRAVVCPEGLCQWKILVTPSGIELATFWLVAQCLNQMHHRVLYLLTIQAPVVIYMYHQLNVQQCYILPTQCICVFCVDLRTNSDYFRIQH